MPDTESGSVKSNASDEIEKEELVSEVVLSEGTLKKPTYRFIREVYDNGVAFEKFEQLLDKALEAKVNYIIIEPTRLGDETGRWIYVGNFLHKTAVISGLASIISGVIWQSRPLIYTPISVISLVCTGLYTVSWDYDPCCQYQVIKKLPASLNISLAELSPVILSYSENTRAKYFHRSVTLASTAFCVWNIYKAIKQ